MAAAKRRGRRAGAKAAAQSEANRIIETLDAMETTELHLRMKDIRARSRSPGAARMPSHAPEVGFDHDLNWKTAENAARKKKIASGWM